MKRLNLYTITRLSLLLACVGLLTRRQVLPKYQMYTSVPSAPLDIHLKPFMLASSETENITSQLHFVIVVASFHFSETQGCGGCTSLLQIREELLELGHEVDMHSMLVPKKCSHVRVNESIVVYPEVVPWSCEGEPLLHVRWMLAPAGKNMPSSTTDSWSQSDWVYNYDTYAPGINVTVPDENILMVIRNPYEGDYFDELAQHKPRVLERDWCFTRRKMGIFHNADLVVDIHPQEAADLPSDVNSAAEMFRTTKYFVSYDPYTMLTYIAPWLGCVPIVYPMAGMTKLEWFESTSWGPYLRETNRTAIMDGVAYGNDDKEIERAQSNVHHMRSEFLAVKTWGTTTVKRFCNDLHAYIAGKPHEIIGRRLVSHFYPPGWYISR